MSSKRELEKLAKKRRQAFLILGLVAVGLGAYAYATIWLAPPARDADLCVKTQEIGQTIILVDKTDPWSADQGNRLENHIWNQITNVTQQDERISIFTFVDTFLPGFPHVFSRCKPEATGNDITVSKRIIEQSYRSEFSDPLQSVLLEIKKSDQRRCSPIAAVMLDILTRAEFRDRRGPNRLVVFSDMRENSDFFSFFSGTQSCDPSRSKDNAALVRLFTQRRSEVKISSVTIYQIPAGDNPVTNPVKDNQIHKFWDELFAPLGLKLEWKRL